MNDRERLPIELRKQLLITQGAMYRSGIVGSREKVIQGLGAESLAKSALKQVGLAVFSLWRGRSSMSMTNLPTLLPILMTGASGLLRPIIKTPILRRAVMLSVMASSAVLFYKLKKRTRTDVTDVVDTPDDSEEMQDPQ